MSAWACDCGRAFDQIRGYRLHVRRCQDLPSAARPSRQSDQDTITASLAGVDASTARDLGWSEANETAARGRVDRLDGWNETRHCPTVTWRTYLDGKLLGNEPPF